jgi:membrane protease YdiL (CAAX protease family)
MSVATVAGGLAIAFLGHPVARWAGGRLDAPALRLGDETLRGDLLKWLVTGALLAYIAVVEREPLSSLGTGRPDPVPTGGVLDGVVAGLDGFVAGLSGFVVVPGGAWDVLAWWSGGVLATVALSTVVYNLFRHFDLGTQDEFAAAQAARPTAAAAFTAVTAGVTESVLFQAYPIERLAALSGSLLAAALVSWLAFTAVHYASGRFSLEETVFTSAPALVVTALYALSGSLLVVVLVHTTVNALSFLAQ